MNRAERRAAAHATRKAARKAGFPNSTTQSETVATPNPVQDPIITFNEDALQQRAAAHIKSQISEAQHIANKANSLRSTGPTSSAGRQKISQNALKTGLTGHQVLLPSDDASIYESQLNQYKDQFQPVGPDETHLLQSIVDCSWRLARIPGLESALIDLGRLKLLSHEPALANNPRPVLEMQIRLFMVREFKNLQLQEGRLARRRERELKQLRELQAIRKAEEASSAKEEDAAKSAKPNGASAPAQNGFVFTPSQFSQFLTTLSPDQRQNFLAEVITSVASTGETLQAVA